MIAADTLRVPGPSDPARSSYKEWLHLILVEHDEDLIGLLNVSIHGPPEGGTTQVVAAALFDAAGQEWIGNVVPGAWNEASITLSGISTASVSVAFGPDDRLLAAVTMDRISLDVVATAATGAHMIDDPGQFGSGWIGWRLVPRLGVAGSIELDGRRLNVSRVAAYHDHNWGRWHWGENIGWEWGSFLGRSGSSVVAGRTTNRIHDAYGQFTVIVDHDGARCSFTTARVTADWSGIAASPSRRLPGALAALHADVRTPRLPSVLHLTAKNGHDAVDLVFESRAVAQLILADPIDVGSSFLHEMSGRFTATGRIAGRSFEFDGLGMVERLE